MAARHGAGLGLCLLLLSFIHDTLAQGSISCDPPSLSGEATWITVSWTNIPVRSNGTNDIVAIYMDIASDAQQIISTVDPIYFVLPYTVNKTAWSLGQGSYRFYVVNHRQNLRVMYLTGNIYYTATILASLPLVQTTPNIPMHSSLVVTGQPNAIRLSWLTADMGSAPLAKWGFKSGVYFHQAPASTDTYTASDLCSAPANSTGFAKPGYINSVTMHNLKAGTVYFYMFGDAKLGWSSEGTFRTVPNNEHSTIRLLAWADQGAYNPDNSRFVLGTFGDEIERVAGTPTPGPATTLLTSLSVTLGVSPWNSAWIATDALNTEAAKGIYHAGVLNGDISYAYGNIYRWDNWQNLNKPTISSMPMLYSPGNHEADDPALPYAAWGSDSDSGGECGVPYEKRLQVPDVTPGLLWYSVDLGTIHFLQLSTEQAFWPGSTQYAFIQRDLAAVNRKLTPWIIVGVHRPVYCDDPNIGPAGNAVVGPLMQQYLEPLFVQYQVDMVWAGHIHWYHRSCPIMKGTCVGYNKDGTAKGPVHIIMGNAGGLPSIITYPEQPSWMEATTVDFGYCTVVVTRTNLTLNAYTGTSVGNTSLFDSVVLVKPGSWKPSPVAAMTLYNKTVATPLMTTGFNAGYLAQLATIALELSVKPEFEDLVYACFGPDSPAYGVANSATLPLMTKQQVWAFSASALGFLKAAYTGNDTNPDYLAALDYAYSVVVSGRWKALGTLPAGCSV